MIARYKDLCIDATDAAPSAMFWSAVLGLGPVVDRDGVLCLHGPTPQHTVWINPVPERKTVKNRLHLDVHCRSIDELVALGATVVEDFERWTVLTDPDGGEFCGFARADPPPLRLYELVLDAVDPAPIAQWWATTLGGDLSAVADDEYEIGAVPGAPFQCFVIGRVPEPKTGKNRVHLDVEVDDVGLLVEHGATVLRRPDGDIGATVLADPDGNEFCAFTP